MSTERIVNHHERGQTLLMFVLALTVLLGFTAMAIDVGLFFQDRRHLQNTADAAALAGAVELPLNTVGAKNRAEEWAANNGVPASEIKTIEVRTTDFPNDTLYVEVEKEFSWIFGRVLGQTTSTVGAAAAAQTGSFGPTSNLMPWAIVEGDPNCFYASGDALFGSSCVVKVGAGSGITGWYGALDYDGTGGGSNEYQQNIVDGHVDTLYCADGDTTCPGTSTVDALNGNKVGGTGHGIDGRLVAEPTPGCDTNSNRKDDFGEVYASSSSGPTKYTIICPHSPRVVVVPIVELEGMPIATVKIKGWTLGYLDGYLCVSCSGGKGHWEVNITMVDAIYSQAQGWISATNPFGGVKIPRLVQ